MDTDLNGNTRLGGNAGPADARLAADPRHASGDARRDGQRDGRDHRDANSFRALPDEAPLAMPTQSLRIAPARSARPASSPRGIGTRRLLVIGGAAALSVAGTYQ